ncbi:catechol 2,3-dioxygenase-like lactoylglutathione lyase family enzyme [Geothermobacter ehrlichii]|uniref:Catechol 2,3-dioxygenase-like lactoylglutathione lyase family enzyme n=1 Tax=Geothermobacter ehrlichii TaxID=213224 RepID=A0A5D3WLC5_9BACT|nr:VOC family protein [Geothermobacter ehrlichii]TYO99237.1 catechol 2,3-dioxygenase-like lactoylglutathione lyase family enzyme [Geothermobacter ehrlichii]
MGFILTLAVHDLERTETFYREILGLRLHWLEPGDRFPPLLMLPQGDTAILFRQSRHLEASHPALFQNIDRHAKGVGMTLELDIPDIEATGRAIRRHRLHLLYELEDDEHDRKEFWLHDPDGYLLILSAADQENS